MLLSDVVGVFLGENPEKCLDPVGMPSCARLTLAVGRFIDYVGLYGSYVNHRWRFFISATHVHDVHKKCCAHRPVSFLLEVIMMFVCWMSVRYHDDAILLRLTFIT